MKQRVSWSYQLKLSGLAGLLSLLFFCHAAFARDLALLNATIIDGRGGPSIENGAVLILDGKIADLGVAKDTDIPDGLERLDFRGHYIIPGLMNANVHLYSGYFVEVLAAYEDQYEEVIEEAAQLALANGVTTVFDTWGPLEPLLRVRNKINSGETPGARMFVAGNIIGFDGPLSNDFNADAQESVLPPFRQRINATWEENVGASLMYQSPEIVRKEIRKYIARGVDFLKYAASGHNIEHAHFLGFSEAAQKVIIEEAHKASITVQTHTMSIEAVRIAIEAGVDLMQHCEATGPVLLPHETIDLMKARKVHCAVVPRTIKRVGIEAAQTPPGPTADTFNSMNLNVNLLVGAEAPIIMSTDALFWPEGMSGVSGASTDSHDVSTDIRDGHFLWFQAMEERGMDPMRALMAATRDVAAAYDKLDSLGTLEAGKIADLVVLERNPLASARNYRSIKLVIKDGVVVDRDLLPLNPVFTKSPDGVDANGEKE